MFVILSLCCVCMFGCHDRHQSQEDIILKVMTYNIRYGHTSNSAGNNYDIDGTAKQILECDPDVVTLQEVDVNWGQRTNYDNLLELLEQKTNMNGFFAYIYDKKPDRTGGNYPDRKFGVAFLSKYKFIYSCNHEIMRWNPNPEQGEKEIAIRPGFGEIGINFKGKDVYFYNTHLDVHTNNPDNFNTTMRGVQVHEMLNIMNTRLSEKSYVILCGDMNSSKDDGKAKEVFDPLSQVFNDAWAINKGDPGFSFPENKCRIDYIFYTNNFEVQKSYLVKSDHSDHYPVIAILKLK